MRLPRIAIALAILKVANGMARISDRLIVRDFIQRNSIATRHRPTGPLTGGRI